MQSDVRLRALVYPLTSFKARFTAILAAVCGLFVAAVLQAQTAEEFLNQAEKLAEQGDWFRAGPLYGKAEEGFRVSGDRRQELYAKLGRLHREAEKGAYQAVRDEISELLGDGVIANDPRLQIRALSVLGTINLNLDAGAAAGDWKQVLEIALAIHDTKWENRARGQLGLVAGINGDVSGAAVALYHAIAKAEQIGDLASTLHFSIWLANGLSVHGMPERAVLLLDKAAESTRRADRDVPIQLLLAKVRALSSIPDSDQLKVQKQITKLVQETLDEARRKQTPGAQSEVLNFWAKVRLDRGTYAEAEAPLIESLAVARSASLPREEAQALLLQSELFRATGRAEAASGTITSAMAVLRLVGETYDLPRYVAEQAETEAALGRFAQADALYSQATDLIEGLLVNAPSSGVKSSMIGMLGEIYVGHFRLAVERLHQPSRAFTILEAARGRALYDSIRYARRTKPQIATSAAEREITSLQRRLLGAPLTPGRTRRVLAQLDAAYDRLSPIAFERARAEMTMLRSSPVTVNVLRRQLGADEVFVEYLLDPKGSYALKITRAGLTILSLPPRKQFSDLSRQYVAAIRSKKAAGTSAQALYKLAIAPLKLGAAGVLTIVPDGPLHLVPFAALVNDNGESLNQVLAVTSAPSGTVYHALKIAGERRQRQEPFLGIAYSPNTATATNGSTSRGIFDLRGASLKPLPYGREEIAEAAEAMGKGSVVLSGDIGTEAALKAQPLLTFKIIHVAAHGVSNETEPDRTALVLIPGSPKEDGLWQVREIRETRLNAAIVVLSACETGTGRLQGQEGTMNLARAFLTAGARSVVASLWSVDDRSTATLMSIFYGHVAKGIEVREALRQAQLDFVKAYGEKASPYYWAGFEVIGDGPSVPTLMRQFSWS